MTAARTRRTAVDRRAQLVEIGLELLPTTPVQELTIDEVARRAGISRSLLFHYFPTKRDYYTAVTRAAADALWEHLLPRSGRAVAEPVDSMIDGMLDRFVGWVETYRVAHLAFMRGAAGGDPWAAEVYEEMTDRLVELAVASLALPDDVAHRQLVRAWFAFVQELVLEWTGEPTMSRAELLTLLRDVLERLVSR